MNEHCQCTKNLLDGQQKEPTEKGILGDLIHAKMSKQRPMKANSNNIHNWQNSIKVKGPEPYIHTSHFKLV